MRPRFSSVESSRCARSAAGLPSRRKIGAAAATLAAIAGVAAGALASPGQALAADARLTSAARAEGGGPLTATPFGPPLSPGSATVTSGQSPLAPPVNQATQSPLAAAASYAAPSPLAVASTLSAQSPLATPAATPAPQASPTHQATPAPQPSSTATPPANGGNGQQQSGSPQSPTPRRFSFYDSVTPQAIPQGQIVATYSTGGHPIPVSAVAGRRTVIWIDTLATDPSGSNALDIEPGCASPSQAAGWVRARLTAHPNATAILYSSISEWSQVRADVATLPSSMQAHIRWWIADPNGTPHIVPGADATQWYWGNSYDISSAKPSFTF